MLNETCIVYEHGRGIPHRIHVKAYAVLKDYAEGLIHAGKHNSGRGESLRVGAHYRLFRRKGKPMFALYSHEQYNREHKKRT